MLIQLHLNTRLFSQISRISRYSNRKQRELVDKARVIQKNNKLVEGMNSFNTNYLEIEKPKANADELKPLQHPVNLNSSDTNIVSYKVPPKNLTPYYFIPNEALAPVEIRKFEQPMGTKHLEVCILGAPNAGKSSILNYITERSISAVSNKYNTTDEAKLGIFTDYNTKSQLCLYDTPGVTKASESLKSKLLVTKAWEKIADADMVMFVVDGVKKLDMQVKEAILRLKKYKIEPEIQKMFE